MNPKTSLCFLAVALAAPVCSAVPIFSWETDVEGWTAGAPNSVATSTTGATDGLQSLAVTQPMSGMWWNAGTSISLSTEQMQSIFTNATELKLDVHYPNPGYTSWAADPHVELVIQGEKIGWTGLATRTVTVDGASQTLSFPLTIAQAAAMATGSWGQIVLRFDYGNGGSTSPDAVFYVDNFSNTVVADPPPATNLYWKGDVDDQWTSLNWTIDLAGTLPGGALPIDGSAGIAFATDGSSNLTSVLGANQNVSSIVVTPGVSPSISGAHSLTVGAGGIWLEEAALGLTIDTTGGVVLGANQVWKNKSTSPVFVNSVISGSGTLTKSGAGPIRLGGANTYTGGTIVQQGILALDHADALGGATASLAMNGGSLDLNGLNVTLGALSGVGGGVITNLFFDPATLTIDDDIGSNYGGGINDGTGTVSLVKTGSGPLTLSGAGNFSGNVTLQEGAVTATSFAGGAPNNTNFGNAQIPGRTITVESAASLFFGGNDILGSAPANMASLPTIVLNGSTLDSTRYNQLGNVTLNGGTLTQSSSEGGDYHGWQFKGEVSVTGSTPSFIQSGNGRANHLSADTVFNVANVTGDAAPDLIVSNPLVNQSGNFGNAAGGLSKTGTGTMALDGFNTYTGATKVLEGVLSLSSASLSDGAGVEIAAGAVLDLAHGDVDRVLELMIDSSIMPVGVYGASDSGAQFERPEITGTGFLEVVADPYYPWIADFSTLSGASAAKSADPDHDGLTNGEEFGLDENPVDGTPSGKIRSRLETIGADQVLVITLPVRDGASFTGTAPAIANVVVDGIDYEIGGSNDLVAFDQDVSEVVPALTGTPDMPGLNFGWSYRTFRLDGPVGGGTPRGPKGFLSVTVTAP